MIDDTLKVSMNEYLPLRDVVFNTLRKAILMGDLGPGERLMENQLAEKMGVSRTPIREAIRKLELEGLVVMVPRKGAQVAEITVKDVKDVLEVRGALEELAVRLACKKITEEAVQNLQSTMKKFTEALENDDLEQLIHLDIEFHDIIFESTENEKLIQIINNLREQVYRFRAAYLQQKAVHLTIDEEHRSITAAIMKQDVEEAARLTVEHIRNQERSVIKMVQAEKNR